jgi:hypothetical protein
MLVLAASIAMVLGAGRAVMVMMALVHCDWCKPEKGKQSVAHLAITLTVDKPVENRHT